jgi:hypothetical protein
MRPRPATAKPRGPGYSEPMPPDTPAFDPDAMVARFRQRAAAVRNRGLPPVEGAERRRFAEQAQVDFMDFAMVGDATATLEDGILTLRIDLRPPVDRSAKTEADAPQPP